MNKQELNGAIFLCFPASAIFLHYHKIPLALTDISIMLVSVLGALITFTASPCQHVMWRFFSYILCVHKKLYPTWHLLSGLRLFIQLAKKGWKSVEHFICHNQQMMVICQVANRHKSNKTSKKSVDLSKTTEKGRNTKPFSVMLSYILFSPVWSCKHKCCRYSLYALLAWITEQGIYHQDLLVMRRQKCNVLKVSSEFKSLNWKWWVLLHLLELVTSRVISALLFYNSCDFISPLSTL